MRPTDPSLALAVRVQDRADALSLRLRAERGDGGQGTVEYVALILLVGAILSAVVLAGGKQDFDIASTIGNKLNGMIKSVGSGK